MPPKPKKLQVRRPKFGGRRVGRRTGRGADRTEPARRARYDARKEAEADALANPDPYDFGE